MKKHKACGMAHKKPPQPKASGAVPYGGAVTLSSLL